jgi:glycerol 2-dehydrogenase (NADP+)
MFYSATCVRLALAIPIICIHPSSAVARDIVVLPKSVTPGRISSNYKGAISAAAKLSKEDIAELDGVAAAGKQKRFIMPPWPVKLGFDNWPQPGL